MTQRPVDLHGDLIDVIARPRYFHPCANLALRDCSQRLFEYPDASLRLMRQEDGHCADQSGHDKQSPAQHREHETLHLADVAVADTNEKAPLRQLRPCGEELVVGLATLQRQEDVGALQSEPAI